MTRGKLIISTIVYHWRTELAVLLGAVASTAALAGALFVGDSMRASLKKAAVGRLGRIEHALIAPRFFRESLADELVADDPDATVAPVIMMRGAAIHARTRARASGVNVLGVDHRFWALANDSADVPEDMPDDRAVILNQRLADELGADAGDRVILRMGKPHDIALDTLLGRRDDTTLSIALTVAQILASRDLAAFGLQPQQGAPANAFVPLSVLQRVADRDGHVSALVATGDREKLNKRLAERIAVEDLGTQFRIDTDRRYISAESDRFLISPVIESALLAAGSDQNATATPISAYLANAIKKQSTGANDESNGSAIAYSTIAAVDPGAIRLATPAGDRISSIGADQVVLNAWAANDLNAAPGDTIELDYYVTGPMGRLETRKATLTANHIARMDAISTDPGFTPDYPGVTDAENLTDWDPPFPIDLKRIRDKDEQYWDTYRTAPKAFVALNTGMQLWADHSSGHGRYTSIRFYPAAGSDLEQIRDVIERGVLDRVRPTQVGLSFEPIRARIESAAAGSTDFGMLFIGFSMFLIISAGMLIALLFRLQVERRCKQVGMLLSVGFSSRQIIGLLVAEGAAVSALGGVLGLLLALGYAQVMLHGLRTWWSAAVNAPFLSLHVAPLSIAIGLVAGFVIATGSIAVSVRGLLRRSAAELLGGQLDALRALARYRRPVALIVALSVLVASAVALAVIGTGMTAMSRAGAFFGSGSMMLAACIVALAWAFRPRPGGGIRPGSALALLRLGIRNTCRHRNRSLLTAGLIGSAVFIIAALQSFRLSVSDLATGRDSGTGGFPLLAEAPAPLPYDLNTGKGRELLNFTDAKAAVFDRMQVMPLRLRPGDQTGCLNLFVPSKPRILGAPTQLIDRGGFQFASHIATDAGNSHNPWRLLNQPLEDGVVPVIGDENAVLWQLHSGLGKELTIEDETGQPVTLRFVALLKQSTLQDELIISEANFKRLFPSIDGYGFFLIDAPAGAVDKLSATLERELEPFGLDVTRSADRLESYLSVQNTYLSTFQALGGLGLILGTLGLAAVVLRSVWERRSELALMQAVGFSRFRIGIVVLSENALLVTAGIASGMLAAAVAISPDLWAHPATIPWLSLAVIVVGVIVVGLVAATLAVARFLSAPLVPALRSE